MKSRTCPSLLLLFVVTLFGMGQSPSVAIAQGNSPVGTWEVSISGVDRGVAFVTFSNDFTLAGYAITFNNADLSTLSGTWSQDAQGNVLGTYTEVVNGQNRPGSFVLSVKEGSSLKGTATNNNGNFKLKGIPASTVPDISGHWNGVVKQAGVTAVESYDITPSGTYPGVYDVVGSGPGFTITGTVIISSGDVVYGFSLSDFGTATLLATFGGKIDPSKGTGKLKGIDEQGVKLSIQVSR